MISARSSSRSSDLSVRPALRSSVAGCTSPINLFSWAALTGIRPRSDAYRASESRARNSLLVMSRALVNSPHERISLSVTCKRVCSINSSRAVRSR